MGASRVVLAREVSFKEMAEIRRRVDIELEVFGHGALCISWSGRCLLSNFFSPTDAASPTKANASRHAASNTASSKNPDRGQYWPVEEDEHGTYVFNSKDLCMVDNIKDLISKAALPPLKSKAV